MSRAAARAAPAPLPPAPPAVEIFEASIDEHGALAVDGLVAAGTDLGGAGLHLADGGFSPLAFDTWTEDGASRFAYFGVPPGGDAAQGAALSLEPGGPRYPLSARRSMVDSHHFSDADYYATPALAEAWIRGGGDRVCILIAETGPDGPPGDTTQLGQALRARGWDIALLGIGSRPVLERQSHRLAIQFSALFNAWLSAGAGPEIARDRLSAIMSALRARYPNATVIVQGAEATRALFGDRRLVGAVTISASDFAVAETSRKARLDRDQHLRQLANLSSAVVLFASGWEREYLKALAPHARVLLVDEGPGGETAFAELDLLARPAEHEAVAGLAARLESATAHARTAWGPRAAYLSVGDRAVDELLPADVDPRKIYLAPNCALATDGERFEALSEGGAPGVVVLTRSKAVLARLEAVLGAIGVGAVGLV